MKRVDLPLAMRLRLRIFGPIYLEHRKHPGWSRSEPFYLASCPEHGPYETYPQGFEGRIRCPRCSSYTVAGTG